MLKTKEIRTYIKQQGEEGVIRVLESLSEQINQNARDMKELATYFDKVVELTGNMADGFGAVKERIQKMEAAHEDLGISTQSLDKD